MIQSCLISLHYIFMIEYLKNRIKIFVHYIESKSCMKTVLHRFSATFQKCGKVDMNKDLSHIFFD